MQTEPLAARSPRPVRGSFWMFVGLAGASAGMTCLYLGMRAVMEIGGTCAEGGPFVIEDPCPQGVPLLIMGAIWGGIIFAGVYAWQVIKHQAPSFLALLWPGLFLSLGWNFLEFGLNPPGGEGLVWGWLICAGLFIAMGGVPLLFAVKVMSRRFRGAPGRGAFAAISGVGDVRRQVRDVVTVARRASEAAAAARLGRDAPGREEDLVSALERLDHLRRSGGLTESEYQAAKARVLGGM